MAISQARRELLVFFSRPAFSGNARALYEHLREASPDLDMVWIAEDRVTNERLKGRGVPSVEHRSIGGVRAQAGAKVLATTHGLLAARYFPWLRVVSLWHGMSPKGVGFTRLSSTARERTQKTRFGSRIDLATSSSLNMSHVLTAAHGIDPTKIVVTGHPRNDWLFTWPATSIEAILPDLPSGGKVILYVPTTRRGAEAGEGIPRLRELWECNHLRCALESTCSVLLVKPHPYDEGNVTGGGHLSGTGPIRFITTESLERHGLDLYQILPGVDVLITDYSSVYFDFLLLDRPIVFFSPDLDVFSESRGFKVEPLDLWMPGPCFRSLSDLAAGLAAILSGPDEFGAHRQVIRRLVHRFADEGSCARIWSAMRSTVLR